MEGEIDGIFLGVLVGPEYLGDFTGKSVTFLKLRPNYTPEDCKLLVDWLVQNPQRPAVMVVEEEDEESGIGMPSTLYGRLTPIDGLRFYPGSPMEDNPWVY